MKNKILYVAVVIGVNNEIISLREMGDFACFLDYDKDKAVQRAKDALDAWSTTQREYKIIVGTIDSEAVFKKEYTLRKL